MSQYIHVGIFLITVPNLFVIALMVLACIVAVLVQLPLPRTLTGVPTGPDAPAPVDDYPPPPTHQPHPPRHQPSPHRASMLPIRSPRRLLERLALWTSMWGTPHSP